METTVREKILKFAQDKRNHYTVEAAIWTRVVSTLESFCLQCGIYTYGSMEDHLKDCKESPSA